MITVSVHLDGFKGNKLILNKKEAIDFVSSFFDDDSQITEDNAYVFMTYKEMSQDEYDNIEEFQGF